MTINEKRLVTKEQDPHRKPRPTDEQKNIIVGILLDFLQDEDAENLGSYLRHVGFDVRAVPDTAALPAAWAAHYRVKQGIYDVERAINDLATWPPIAARIAELRAERDGL